MQAHPNPQITEHHEAETAAAARRQRMLAPARFEVRLQPVAPSWVRHR